MMTDLENKYKNLTERELRLLIANDDSEATEEFIRRSKSGEIKRRHYTLEQLDEMIKNLDTKKKSA